MANRLDRWPLIFLIGIPLYAGMFWYFGVGPVVSFIVSALVLLFVIYIPVALLAGR